MAQCKISYYPLHLGVFLRDNTVRLWNVNEIRMDHNAHKCELWNQVYKHSRGRTATVLLPPSWRSFANNKDWFHYRLRVLWDWSCSFSLLIEKTRSPNQLEMSDQRHHSLLSYFKTLSAALNKNRNRANRFIIRYPSNWNSQLAVSIL